MKLKNLLIFTSCYLIAQKEYSIAIIGSGPAGLSAALYAARAKIDHIYIEGDESGGQLIKASLIENWPGIEKISGYDLSESLLKQVNDLGSQSIKGNVIALDTTKTPFIITIDQKGKTISIEAKTIIIATGTKPNKLGCPGEDIYVGTGIALCANCDAPLFENKKVIVIGGGYEALREIGIIAKYSKDITVINKSDNLQGPKMLMNYVTDNKNIKVLNGFETKEILGNGSKATGVKIVDKKNNEEKTLEAEGIFIATGWLPQTDIFKDKIKLNKKKQIITNNTKTSVPGIFAAGDVTSESLHQAIVASAQGYQAAMNAEKYLCQSETMCKFDH